MTTTTTSKYESLFQPYVTINDDGRIDVDFADSYVHTINEDTQQETYDGPVAQSHIDTFDAILGSGTSPQRRLRALADLLDAQEAS